MEWTEAISGWLREGEEGAQNILEYPWDVEVTQVEGLPERELITATHPKIPLNIEVVVSRHFTNLVINPMIPTDAISVEERMRLYKSLLHLNSDLNLMKAGLVGQNDNPVIQVDLDLESISMKEFNDALTLLLIGAQNLITILGLEQKIQDFMIERFKQFVVVKMAGGESKEDILDFLMNRGGLEEETASLLFDQVAALIEANGEKKEEPEAGSEQPSDYDGPMYG